MSPVYLDDDLAPDLTDEAIQFADVAVYEQIATAIENSTCFECGATQFMHELTCPTLTQSPVRHDAARER